MCLLHIAPVGAATCDEELGLEHDQGRGPLLLATTGGVIKRIYEDDT